MSNLLNGTGASCQSGSAFFAFSMSINKGQCQALKKVGVWLEQPTFTHGQLYVAVSRLGDPHHLHFAVSKSVSIKTMNVAYKEIL